MKKILPLLLMITLVGCQSMPTVKNVLQSRTFHENAYKLQITKTRYGKTRIQTIYLFKVEPGFDATVQASLRDFADIEGAIKYMDIMCQQFKNDMRSRTALNISFLYYLIGDRDKLEQYYQFANMQDFSDETQSALKQMTILYPNY